MKIRCVFGLLAVSAFAHAQSSSSGVPDGYIALLRSDVQTEKVGIIRQNLTLTADQAEKFWPLQRSYENDLSKIGDERVNVIRDYAKNWDSMTDSTAKDLGNKILEYQEKRVDLRKKYFDRISKEVSPIVSAKFFQIEVLLEEFIDLEISSALPLIKQPS